MLSNLGTRTLYFSGRGQRHPLGVFNLTLPEIVKHMGKVLDELARAANDATYANPKNYDWHRDLLNATDHLLDAVVQHLDCYGMIVESLFEGRPGDQRDLGELAAISRLLSSSAGCWSC